MPRGPNSLEGVRQKMMEEAARRERGEHSHGGLDYEEVATLVCKYVCQGYMAADIVRLLQDEHHIKVSREEPYRLLAYAAMKKWLRFVAPYEVVLREKVRSRYTWLSEAEVSHTSVFDDQHAALMLMNLIRTHHMPPYSKDEVHVGFAGGYSMRRLAHALSEMLRLPAENLPKKIVFHALVSGFDPFEPTTAPNAFFTYFVKDLAMQVDTGFVSLHAPALVRSGRFEELKTLEGIREAYQCVDQIDIIATSASGWSDEHSMHHNYMKNSPKSLKMLQEAGCVGDMLWRPLSDAGPIELNTEIRAMTVLELPDLEKFIQQGKHVLLALGPCSLCHAPKTDILRAILNQPKRLITHLVVDSRSAAGLFKGEPDTTWS
jgi:DNA-binding transcriptional regulator LsrR (DeoR family)